MEANIIKRLLAYCQDRVLLIRRKREAKQEGMPFRKKEWYNYMAMLSKDSLAERTFVEIFDKDGHYIDCPHVGEEVILNNRGKRYRYRIIGFKNDSRNRDWLYDTDYINPIIEYIGKASTE